MDSSNYNEYRNFISSLSEDNFNDLVLSYIKEYYNTKDAYISNGPYDGGNDLIIAVDGKEIKRNIQITVQSKELPKKIIEDVIKAHDNVAQYAYLSKLDFYCSHHISGEKKNELKRTAEVDYNIDLNIYDNYRLGELVAEYKSMQDVIRKVYRRAFPNESLQLDRNTKILFDHLSVSKDIGAIKVNFIISFILFHFYEKGISTTDEVFTALNSTFCNRFDRPYYENLIGRLNEKGDIYVVDNNKPKKFDLSTSTRRRLEEIENNSNLTEIALLNELHRILTNYNVNLNTKELGDKILKMFNDNYSLDIEEMTKGQDNLSKRLKRAYNDLASYIRKNTKLDDDTSKQLANELIKASDANPLINKSSISKMFINLFRNDKLDEYLNTSERKLFLDTQILLQLICVTFKDFDNPDRLYSTVKVFKNSIKKSNIPISLHTTTGYIDEVVAHLHNALKLERFLSLPYIKSLGPSKNVFFNFYHQLCNVVHYDSFAEFVSILLGIDMDEVNSGKDFILEATPVLSDILKGLGISIETPPIFDDYQKYQKEYETTLSYHKLEHKSYEARKNDLNTILYISKESQQKEDEISPYLITWDSSFYNVRNDFRKFTELGYWYIYSPQKFSNTISILNFKIDPSSVNDNIISLVEENFNASNETISFIDLLNGLFDKEDVSEWALAQKFAKLRAKLAKEEEEEDKNKVEFKNLPIDEFLLLILNTYQSNSNGNIKYADLTSLFQNNQYSDQIMDIINKYIHDFKSEDNKLRSEILEEMNRLILINREE